MEGEFEILRSAINNVMAEVSRLQGMVADSRQEEAGGEIRLPDEKPYILPEENDDPPPATILPKDKGMFAWDPVEKQIGAGGVMVGRKWISIGASEKGKADGTYYVKVTLGTTSRQDQAEITNSTESTGTAITYIPIYTVSQGQVTGDMRWAFVVQCWEA